jgi:hypothetical protein
MESNEELRRRYGDALSQQRQDKASDIRETADLGASGNSDKQTPYTPFEQPKPRQSGDSQSTYDIMRTQNYKNLLDTQIQLASAKQNALKAANARMAEAGLYGTGYAGVANTGIQNAYMNALSNARQGYNDSELDITAQENEANDAKSGSNFEALTSLMGSAQDLGGLNSVLNEYGIKVADDGTLIGAGDYWNSLSDEDKRQLRVTYNLMRNGYLYSGSPMSDASSMRASLTMNTGESADIGNNYGLQSEISYLFNNLGDYAKEGMVVKLTNGKNPVDNVAYVIYHNGNWYQTTSSQYEGAGNKAEIKDGKDVSSSKRQSDGGKDSPRDADELELIRVGIDGYGNEEEIRRKARSAGAGDDEIEELVALWRARRR